MSGHAGGGWARARASKSGIAATSQLARPPLGPCADSAIPATSLRGPSSSDARRAVAAPTRPGSHSGKAVTAASGVGHAGGARSTSESAPNASRSSRVRSTESGAVERAVQPRYGFRRIEYRAPRKRERRRGEQQAEMTPRVRARLGEPAAEAQRSHADIQQGDQDRARHARQEDEPVQALEPG